jgi:zinc transporter ZupT
VRAGGWDEPASIALLALFGLGGVLLLVFTGLAVLVARRPSSRRRLKILVVAVAGGVCGTLWVLSIATILAAARPGTLTDLPLLAVGAVVALIPIILTTRVALSQSATRPGDDSWSSAMWSVARQPG